MPDRVIVLCVECGTPYTARVHDDQFVLSTENSECECGSEAFVQADVPHRTDAAR